MKKIVAISGSRRAGSFNTQLLQRCTELIVNSEGAAVDIVAGADLGFPLYEQDLEDESGFPAEVQSLFDRVQDADSALIASPEYNGGYTPLLKNAFDWLSRIDHRLFAERHVAVLTASPGKGGGARSGEKTKQLFSDVRANVHPKAFNLPVAHEALAESSVPGLNTWVDEYLAALANETAH